MNDLSAASAGAVVAHRLDSPPSETNSTTTLSITLVAHGSECLSHLETGGHKSCDIHIRISKIMFRNESLP